MRELISMIDRGNQDWRLMSRPTLNFVAGTPRSVDFDDDYYSPTNGLAESSYVYIEGAEIVPRIKALKAGQTLTIAELGVGTALNLALLLQAWSLFAPADAHCHYIGIEKYPLRRAQLAQVNAQWEALVEINEVIRSRWPAPIPGCHRRNSILPGFSADFWWGDANDVLSDLQGYQQTWIDVWFLDGFSPARNESMWGEAVIDRLMPLSKPEAIITTFTAAGHVRRALEHNGFSVTKRTGFGGKRECMAATLSNRPALKAVRFDTDWDQPKHCASPKNCLVIGAGLAGSHIARKLAEAGCTVTVLERNSLASGGSSQPQGVIYTRPSHKHGKLADFSLAAYCLSTDHHQQLFSHQQLYEGVDGEMSGYIQLRDADKLTLLTSAFADEDSPVKFVTPQEASRIAGIPLDRGGMYFPDSGWLNPAGVCRSLINHPKITLVEGVGAVKPRQLDSGLWAAENQKGQTIAVGDTVILTTAWQATDSTGLDFLPLQPIRGQTTQLSSNGVLTKMRCTVCHDGYTPPARSGEHCIGATYGLNETTLEERAEDHHLNLSQLASNVPSLTGALSEQRLTGIAAVRCATSDYLPIAGPVPDKIAFNRIFEGLRHDRKRHIDAQQPNIEGLWVFTGLGSRGLTSAPLLSEMLVSMMFQRPPPLPRYLMQAVSPARFLRRRLIKGE